MSQEKSLVEARRGDTYTIKALEFKESESQVRQRIEDIGFTIGEKVSLEHFGPVGGDPLAVRVRGSLIAIRKSDALKIIIENND